MLTVNEIDMRPPSHRRARLAAVLLLCSAVCAISAAKTIEEADPSWRQPLAESVRLESESRWGEALVAARSAESLAPQEPEAVRVVARLLVRTGARPQALVQLERLRTIAPRDVSGYHLTALLLRDDGRIAEAVELLEAGRAAGVASAESLSELAYLLVELGDYTRAEEIATQQGDEPALAEPARRAVVGLVAARDPERRDLAIDELTAALEAGIDRRGALEFELARLLLAAGETDRGLARLESLALQPEMEPDVYYQLGLARRQAGDTPGAAAAFERFEAARQRAEGLDRAAQQFGIGLNEAQNLARSNKVEDALERIAQLEETFPDKHPALALKGKLLFSMRRFDEALVAIRRGRKLAPGELEYRYLEGWFAAEAGRLLEARRALETALAIDPELEEARRILNQVIERMDAKVAPQ